MESAGKRENLYQNIVVMRHGDRIDNFEPLWAADASRKWDPPLVDAGKVRAFCTGKKLRHHQFPIHRVFVSPFLRCLQTASEVITALCAIQDDPQHSSSQNVQIDSSKIKVAIEYGLCEMLNNEAIRSKMAPKDGNFGFNISECEANLPAGTVDTTYKRVYQEMPKWGESVSDARSRYLAVIKALADKFPSENLLLVTHGEGVGVSLSAFLNDTTVYEVEYCAYTHSKRMVSLGQGNSFTAGEFEVLTQGQTGIMYATAQHG